MSLFQAPFNELSPETLNAEVMKYVKDVLRLEKGLPPNGVVPILKEKVDNMRVKVSKYIRNFIVIRKSMPHYCLIVVFRACGFSSYAVQWHANFCSGTSLWSVSFQKFLRFIPVTFTKM